MKQRPAGHGEPLRAAHREAPGRPCPAPRPSRPRPARGSSRPLGAIPPGRHREGPRERHSRLYSAMSRFSAVPAMARPRRRFRVRGQSGPGWAGRGAALYPAAVSSMVAPSPPAGAAPGGNAPGIPCAKRRERGSCSGTAGRHRGIRKMPHGTAAVRVCSRAHRWDSLERPPHGLSRRDGPQGAGGPRSSQLELLLQVTAKGGSALRRAGTTPWDPRDSPAQLTANCIRE